MLFLTAIKGSISDLFSKFVLKCCKYLLLYSLDPRSIIISTFARVDNKKGIGVTTSLLLRAVLTSILLFERFCYFLLAVDFAFTLAVGFLVTVFALRTFLRSPPILNIFVPQMVQNPDRAC